MAYIVPTFNLVCNYWNRSAWLTTWPTTIATPTIADLPCQLRWGNVIKAWGNVSTGAAIFDELVVPKGSDVRAPKKDSPEASMSPDIVEVPSGSSRYYFVTEVHDVAKGFPNEYRVAVLFPTNLAEGTEYTGRIGYPWVPQWPTPYP